MTHSWYRDLHIELESPSGVTSVPTVSDFPLHPLFAYFGLGLDGAFRFGSAKHLGEDASGEWTLHIRDEAGSLTLSSEQPQVDNQLIATLTDPDGGLTGQSWTWHRSPDRINWTIISGEASNRYRAVEADVGQFLRATVEYTASYS